MPHRLLFVDAETYYDDEYSLKKMPPPNYILDPRFELICCAVKDGGENFLVDGPDFGRFLGSLDPANTTIVAFNALFDCCILAWRYRFVPASMLCSMRMAVALRGHALPGASLAAVSQALCVGTKGTEIQNVKGMHRADILASGRWNQYARYCLNDNELNAAIFFKLIGEYPVSERRTMARVLRCAIEPEFWLDKDLLAQHVKDLAADKVALLHAAGVTDPGVLRSNPQFEALLKSHGVDIEYKTTATGNTAPAFAKTDEFMERLLEHEDPTVAALASARLGFRSTIEESRGQRLLSLANLDWLCYRDGNAPLMPMPYRISGGHTHRLSGEWKLNMQNLPSGRGGKSKLRQSLIAPPGHQVLIGDLSQIEARICAWLCRQMDLLEVFAKGLDPYAILAAAIFGIPLDQIDKKGLERFIGKSGVLGLGFRCGADKFFNMVIRAARGLNMDMAQLMAIWTPQLAQRTVDVYRQKNAAIKRAWYTLDRLLAGPWCGMGAPQTWGPVEIGPGYVALPSGLKMNYDVKCTDPNQDLTYQYGRKIHKMHGGVMLENIVQALAYMILMNAANRLWARGLRFKLQSHDELGFIVPDAAVGRDANGKPIGPAVEILKRELTRRPSFAPDLPLACEVEFGRSYGDAK